MMLTAQTKKSACGADWWGFISIIINSGKKLSTYLFFFSSQKLSINKIERHLLIFILSNYIYSRFYTLKVFSDC